MTREVRSDLFLFRPKSYRFSTEVLPVVSLELNYMCTFYLGVNPNASKIGVSKLNGMRNRHGNDKPAEV